MLPRFETHNTEFVYNLISLLNLLPFLVIIDMPTHHTHTHTPTSTCTITFQISRDPYADKYSRIFILKKNKTIKHIYIKLSKVSTTIYY